MKAYRNISHHHAHVNGALLMTMTYYHQSSMSSFITSPVHFVPSITSNYKTMKPVGVCLYLKYTYKFRRYMLSRAPRV